MKISYDLTEINEVAATVIKNAGSKILLFYGAMGSGKTTLIKAIVKHLGINELTGSPTFALVNEYGDMNKVYHFDFYRIENETEAYHIGFEDYLLTDAWICIEWPEKIAGLLPEQYTAIRLTEAENNKRTLVLE